MFEEDPNLDIPGRREALCRAHDMRTMRDEGISLELIAKFYCYSASTVVDLLRWHEKLYLMLPPVEGPDAPWYLKPPFKTPE